MYKKNSRDSIKFMGYSPLQLCCDFPGMKPEIGCYSYTGHCVPNSSIPREGKNSMSWPFLGYHVVQIRKYEEN